MKKLILLLITIITVQLQAQEGETVKFFKSTKEFRKHQVFVELPNDTIRKFLVTKTGIVEGYAVRRVYKCVYDINSEYGDKYFYKTLHYLIDGKVERIDSIYAAKDPQFGSNIIFTTDLQGVTN